MKRLSAIAPTSTAIADYEDAMRPLNSDGPQLSFVVTDVNVRALEIFPTDAKATLYDVWLRGTQRAPIMASLLATLVLTACDGPTDTTESDEPQAPISQLPLIRVNPFRTPAGGSDLTIEVDGLDFTTGSTVYWDGSPRATRFVSGSKLSAAISSQDLATPTIVDVTVVDESGGTTNPLPFFIDATEVQPRFAYVLNHPEGISVYYVDSQTGALSPIVGSPLNAGEFERPFVAHPSGRFIYARVSVALSSTIAWFEVDSVTGTLTHSGSLNSALRKIAMDPAGQFLFALTDGPFPGPSDELVAYTIDPSTGALSDPPISRIATTRASDLATEPSGRFLYTTNGFRVSPPEDPPAGVHTFRVNRGTGELVHLGVRTITSGVGPGSVAADRCGERLFVITNTGTFGGDFRAYNIDPLGTLSEFTGSVVLNEPSIGIAVHPSCESVYVTSRVLQAAAVDRATGSLSPLNQVESGGSFLAMDPSGRFLYVGSGGAVQVFHIDLTSGSMMIETLSSFGIGGGLDGIIVVP